MTATPSSPSKKSRFKEFSSEFDDIDPVITYRHLQSQSIGPRHPLRFIALCDCNAFYANCEQVRLGIDPEKPLVVLQWNALIAVNYPAREFGISRMDKLEDALKRCPELVVVHVATYAQGENEPKYWEKPDVNTHKVSLDLYRRESVKICSLMKELLPTGEVEKASVDEAFIDLSIPVRNAMLERYPYLANSPADAPAGLDSRLPPPPRISFAGLGNLVPVDSSMLGKDTKETTETVEEVEKDLQSTWHDVGLQIAAELITFVRKEIYGRLGYLTSAGIARNKFLAKLGASYRKFNTQNILRNAAIPGFLRPMPFQKIRFLGGKLGNALANEYDVSSVGDLLTVSLDEMQSKFGDCSVWVYEILRGIDRTEVKEKAVINKSMNASKNLQKPVTKPSEGPHWIRMLAAELALRLNEARENTPGLWPRTISLSARFGGGWNNVRGRQQPFPFSNGQMTVDFVAGIAGKLWKELIGTDATMDPKKPMRISHINLGFKDIGWTEDGQQTIQGFLQKTPPALERGTSEGPAGPSKVPDRSHDKRQCSTSLALGSKPKEIISLDSDDSETPLPQVLGDELTERHLYAVDIPESEKWSYTCPRCRKILSLSQATASTSSTNDNGVSREAALASLRMEHDDWHFAQDLSKEGNRPPSKSSGSSSTSRTKKRKQTPEGITKFLVKKTKT